MSGAGEEAGASLERILAEQVYAGSGYKPFSEMTLWVVPPGGSFL